MPSVDRHGNDTLVLIYGPAGCGKTSLSQRLAEVTGGEYVEGDDFHSLKSVEKMRSGHPLQDEERWTWLARLHEHCFSTLACRHNDMPLFLSCSALKSAYRDVFRTTPSPEFEILEAPKDYETDIITLDASLSSEELVAQALRNLEEARVHISPVSQRL